MSSFSRAAIRAASLVATKLVVDEWSSRFRQTLGHNLARRRRRIVRRATGEKSIGHLGTLDPMATGVLPLLLGKYTRLAQFFRKAEKNYTGHIRFGFATDSFDADGVPAGDARPLALSLAELRSLAREFHGEMDQLPPIYSAKKIRRSGGA